MIFNTWSFLGFFTATIIIYWCAVPQRFKPYFLVAIGALFYAYSVPAYLALIAVLGLVTFGVGRAMLGSAEERTRKLLVTAGIVTITAVLVFFKYSKFFALTVNEVSRHSIVPLPNIVVPLAISFFTFEFVHVLVDIYLGKIRELRAVEFAVFTMFFPTLVAGPIKRYQTFAPQVWHIELPPRGDVALSMYRVVIGVAKKVIIADSMSVLTQALVTPDAAPFGRLDYVVAVLAYAAKIYFDFSGYSDIAIGLSGLLGIKIPENFERPYWAENISVFWRRWHMSLSTWIRDYIFIPLGGSRRPPLITMLNLLIAMALAGLWHGAAWTFVAWGLWHGVGLAIHRVWSIRVVPMLGVLSDPRSPFVKPASIALTFAFVAAGWILFAASSFHDAAIVFIRAFF